jgi:hypothetical protein
MRDLDDLPLTDPVIEAFKKDVDRTLLRENLKLTVEERFEKMLSFLRFTDELRRSAEAARAQEGRKGN